MKVSCVGTEGGYICSNTKYFIMDHKPFSVICVVSRSARGICIKSKQNWALKGINSQRRKNRGRWDKGSEILHRCRAHNTIKNRGNIHHPSIASSLGEVFWPVAGRISLEDIHIGVVALCGKMQAFPCPEVGSGAGGCRWRDRGSFPFTMAGRSHGRQAQCL